MIKKIWLKKSMVIVALGLTICAISACDNNKKPVSGDLEEESSTYSDLSSSESSKFSNEDLTVNKLKMGMDIDEVEGILGKPVNMYNSYEIATGTDVLDERIYGYNDLTLIFMPVNGTYRLCAAASVGDNDVFSRGIKVGDSRDKIFEEYYRDVNCLNNNVMTSDNATIIGKYLYGNHTLDNLESKKVSDKIEYGIINYNGFASFETAESYIIEFTYAEPPYKSGEASTNDSFSQIAFDIDNNDIITGIRWYYYPEIDG